MVLGQNVSSAHTPSVQFDSMENSSMPDVVLSVREVEFTGQDCCTVAHPD